MRAAAGVLWPAAGTLESAAGRTAAGVTRTKAQLSGRGRGGPEGAGRARAAYICPVMSDATTVRGSSPAEGTGAARAERAVREAIQAAVRGAGERIVLAVSGGLDSMALLEAAASHARDRVAVVATFDHGTGPSARAAAALVAARAAQLGLPAVGGRATVPAADEAGWRRARWRFLGEIADRHGARVATAHTEDDQVETVFMRALRGAGARGLAGLYADSPVVRPFLALSRATLAEFVAGRGVPFVTDPSNRSRRHLRNRVRLDLLPAIELVRPGFGRELLELARRAAAWRRAVDGVARDLADLDPVSPAAGGELRVAAARLGALDARALGVIWPAVAALGGVTLDRRGTHRLAEFTIKGRTGGAIQISGGLEVVRRRDEFVLRALRDHTSSRQDVMSLTRPASAVPLDGGPRRLGRWRFEPALASPTASSDLWHACFPAEARVLVRPWRAGDRMRIMPGGAARRVKRFFGDAGVAGVDRAGWPVVFADGEIVWIPGVRRSVAATAPSGRPGLCYACHRACERNHDRD